jgi:hypothetical protein
MFHSALARLVAQGSERPQRKKHAQNLTEQKLYLKFIMFFAVFTLSAIVHDSTTRT